MTSNSSVDEARGQICENGFYAINDPEIGLQIQEMEEKQLSFDFSDEAGFTFCLNNVLLNSVGIPPLFPGQLLTKIAYSRYHQFTKV
jgi:hypothetical protein